MKKIILAFILIPVCFFLSGNSSVNSISKYELGFFSDKKMQVGEELIYVVSYTFIKLGEVKIIVKDKKELNGRTFYNTIAYINSYNGIPFVSLHQIYESKVNQDYSSDSFRGIVKHDKYTTFTEYIFDSNNSKIKIKKGKVDPYQLWTDSTAGLNQQLQDGLSIFYYARMNLGTKKSVYAPCFVNEKYETTKINFYTGIQKTDIDAVDYDISCLRLDGKMNFISIYGLTGYFEGWFSNDDASIPIVAKMQLFVGNVSIGENSSVWYNTVIRGDVHYIKIGSWSNVQDCSMLHVTNGKYPLNIGDKVTIGHSVTLHGCTLQNLCLIGMGAVVLDGSVIEEKAMVAAGTVVTSKFVVPSGKLVAGVPGKIIRDLTEIEMDDFENSALRYKKYCEITIKSLRDHNYL